MAELVIMIWFSDIAIYLRYFALLSCGNVAKVLLPFFHSFDQWSRNLLWILHISTSTHSFSFVLYLFVEDIFSHLFPAWSLWSRSISMAFNLILVWWFHESRALMCFNFLSILGGGGWDGWYFLAPLIPFYPLCHALYSYHSFGSWLDSIISSFAKKTFWGTTS